MHTEIQAAADFLANFIKNNSAASSSFHQALVGILSARYDSHWNPFYPFQGSAFRAITVISGRPDSILLAAGQAAGIENLATILPRDLSVWVDPGSCSYRFGDNGYINSIYEDASYTEEDTLSEASSSSLYLGRPGQPLSPPRYYREILVQ